MRHKTRTTLYVEHADQRSKRLKMQLFMQEVIKSLDETGTDIISALRFGLS